MCGKTTVGPSGDAPGDMVLLTVERDDDVFELVDVDIFLPSILKFKWLNSTKKIL